MFTDKIDSFIIHEGCHACNSTGINDMYNAKKNLCELRDFLTECIDTLETFNGTLEGTLQSKFKIFEESKIPLDKIYKSLELCNSMIGAVSHDIMKRKTVNFTKV